MTSIIWIFFVANSLSHGHFGALASNILIWSPRFSLSHVNFMGNIADVLTADGHNVTIYCISLDPRITTFGNRLPASTVLFKPDITMDWLKLEMQSASLWEAPPCEGLCFKWSDYKNVVNHMYNLCEALLHDQGMLDILRHGKFELVFSEAFDPCSPGVWQLVGVKSVVYVSSVGMVPRLYDIVGLSTLPSFMPVGLTPYSDQMTFLERMTNFNLEIFLKYYTDSINYRYWRLYSTRFPEFPTFEEILDEKATLIMTNVNEFTESARPTLNMIKYIGGSAVREPKHLSKDLSAILDKNSANVLFSMGSIVQSSTMPDWLKRDVIEAFDSFPNVTFIWKYESDDYSDVFKAHPNIYPMKWIPQVDLLADPRLTLFITHGGLNSVLEAMNFGKPVIVIPMFADQQMNSKNVAKNGLGIILERHLLNKKTLTEALKHVMGSKEIARKTALVASLLDGRPKQYRQDIAKWARIIIEHGQMDHLKLYSRKLNWLQYYCLDVIAFELSVLLLLVAFVVWLILRLITFVVQKKMKSE